MGDRDFAEAMRNWDVTRGRLLAVARRILPNEEDAKDAVQDALVSAYQARHRFRGEALFSTWMHRIVVNKCLMRIRTRRRFREVPLEPTVERARERVLGRCAWHVPADRALERREGAAFVQLSISRLPEPFRSVVLLRDIDGYDTQEVATALGVTANTVKVRLHRARKALRSLILGSPAGHSWANRLQGPAGVDDGELQA